MIAQPPQPRPLKSDFSRHTPTHYSMLRLWKSLKAVAHFATALLFICQSVGLVQSATVSPKGNMTALPDFAYPKTVAANSYKELSQAVALGNWAESVKATIQNVTAENLISNAHLSDRIAMIDSMASIAPENWRSPFLLLKADFLSQIYMNDIMRFNDRQLPLEDIPSNPAEWSRDIFANEISGICKKMLADISTTATPLKEWRAFLTDTSFAEQYSMTTGEFIAWKCGLILDRIAPQSSQNIIPFFENQASNRTPLGRCGELRQLAFNKLKTSFEEKKQFLLLAYILRQESYSLPYNSRFGVIMDAYRKVKGTEGEQLILSDLNIYVEYGAEDAATSNRPLTKKDYYAMLESSLKAFPGGLYSNALRNAINELSRPASTVDYKERYLSSDSITMECTLSNALSSWLLIFDYSKYADAEKAPKTSIVASNCRLVKAINIKADGRVPFTQKIKADIGTLRPGTYIVVPSATASKSGIYEDIINDTWRRAFEVSDISILSMQASDGTTKLFVVSGENGAPVKGAKVEIFTSQGKFDSPKILAKTLWSDDKGMVCIEEKDFKAVAFHGKSKASIQGRNYNKTTSSRQVGILKKSDILADRSVYHLGDSVKTVAIAYQSDKNEMSLYKNSVLTIKLLDANRKEIGSTQCPTDAFGRATASFAIPGDGLLGSWKLAAYDDQEKEIGSRYIQVADYTPPTFFITIADKPQELALGDAAVIKGSVMTYSGLPLAETKVEYDVDFRNAMRWWNSTAGTYVSTIETDSEGNFEIVLPTDNLKGSPFEKGLFTVRLSATSPSGETQEGPIVRFSLGNEYTIATAWNGDRFEVTGDSIDFKINLNDMLGRNVRKTVEYELTNTATGKIAAKGVFLSPSLILPAKELESAKYSLRLNLEDEKSVSMVSSVIIWRASDACAPRGTGLWTLRQEVYARPEAKNVIVPIGSGKADRWIPAIISSDSGSEEIQWIHVEHDNVELNIPAPEGWNETRINISYLSDLQFETSNITIRSAQAADKLELTTESFRDKLTADDSEKWTFRFKKKYSDCGVIPSIAVMTDKALDAIAPFNWEFMPNSGYYRGGYIMRHPFNPNWNITTGFRRSKFLKWKEMELPNLQDYSYNWGLTDHQFRIRGMMKTGAVMMTNRSFASDSMEEMDEEAEESKDYASAGVEEYASLQEIKAESTMATGGDDGRDATAADSSELREAECPVAFLKPYLESNNDGLLTVDFTVPNFNTTWKFQLIGYDESLQTAKVTLEAVASKPVMVSTLSPRFLHTGDRIILSATAFNNSTEDAKLQGELEIVNLLTGDLIFSKKFEDLLTPALGNRLMTMEWEVPDDVISVGFRAYAQSDGHRDGEQVIIPILPATTPIVKATPFWLAPDQEEIEVKLPKFNNESQLTLQYCANPAWYCLTALPSITTPDSKSILAKARALFGNATGYKLISRNPSLRSGLQAMLSDKNSEFAALKSNLEKDGALKIASLPTTPWVNNAASETLRMSRLSVLLNDSDATTAIERLLSELASAQSADGGWSWCPGLPTSQWITTETLRYLSMAYSNDALSDFSNWKNMAGRAVGYIDAKEIDQYKRYHKKGESLSYLLNWIYVRGSLPSEVVEAGGRNREMKNLISKALSDISKEWKTEGLEWKAKAAIALHRAGMAKEASAILESLRQYASESPEKGTTMALQAFHTIQPENGIIDRLRQWMLLGRQYEDWQDNPEIAETINALLTTGTDWTNTQSQLPPDIWIGKDKLKLPSGAAMTGALTMSIKAKETSNKKLKLTRRSECPSWGAVISQFICPIEEVEPSSVPDLKIEKKLVALIPQTDGSLLPTEVANLQKGMKVRVTLTLTAGRDLNYVAVTDERSACLKPIDQLSGIDFKDGVAFYREVRDSRTNLYFDSLPKGIHVISYDCRVETAGEFGSGIATAQSQYSPSLVSHTGGRRIESK